jgi:dienelactone hydrolase
LAAVVKPIPTEISKAALFKRNIATDQIALVGRALGARSAGLYASRDRRVKAYVAFEGVPPADIRKEGLNAASLTMVGHDFPVSGEVNVLALADKRRAEFTFVRIANATHNPLTDASATAQSHEVRDADARCVDLIVQLLLSTLRLEKRDLACAHPEHITKLMRK